MEEGEGQAGEEEQLDGTHGWARWDGEQKAGLGLQRARERKNRLTGGLKGSNYSEYLGRSEAIGWTGMEVGVIGDS